jgi:hypothetical protein
VCFLLLLHSSWISSQIGDAEGGGGNELTAISPVPIVLNVLVKNICYKSRLNLGLNPNWADVSSFQAS